MAWPSSRYRRQKIEHADGIGRAAGPAEEAQAPQARNIKVSRRDVLWRAWVAVRANNGAPGIDKVTLAVCVSAGRQAPGLRAGRAGGRGVRPLKTQQKISGRLTSPGVTQHRLDIRSYIDTARKHGQDVMTVLRDAMTGAPGPRQHQPDQPPGTRSTPRNARGVTYSAWWLMFNRWPDDREVQITCTLGDGSAIWGSFASFNNSADDSPDRDLILKKPIWIRQSGEPEWHSYNAGIASVSARQIVTLFVSYSDEPAGKATPSMPGQPALGPAQP